MPKGTCSVVENGKRCEKPVNSRGWCKMHWTRWDRHGDPLIVYPFKRSARPLADRFWPKVNKDGPLSDFAPHLGPCWLWTSTKDKRGYGYIGEGGRRGRSRSAHQIAYELVVGPIPEGLELDHLCMVPSCVRPDHLEPVTHEENIRRATEAGRNHNTQKTVCPQGHAYEGDNLVINSMGRRECRICKRQRGLDWYYRNSDPSRRTGRKR